MRDLAAHLRHLFVVQTLGDVPDSFAVTAEHTDRLHAQAGQLPQGEILRAIDLLAAALSAVKDGSDPRIQLELALLKAAQPQSDMSIQALLFRIEQLERRVAQQSGAPARSQPADSVPSGAPAPPRAPAREAQAPPPAAPAPAPVAHAEPVAATAGASASAAQSAPAPVAQPAVGSAEPVAAPEAQAAAAAAPAPEEPEPAPDDPAGPPIALDLDRVRTLWPAIVDTVCKENGMVGAFLADARPIGVSANRLAVCFPPGAGFAKKKVETNRVLVQTALRGLTGTLLEIDYELGGDDFDDAPHMAAANDGLLSDEELLERLKQDFGAREVFDEDPPPNPPTS
jgi:DNA polymerase-3 subunit gamma/tau